MKTDKKGYSLQDMAPIAIAFLVVAVILGIGATILGTIRADNYAGDCASVGGYLNETDTQGVFCAGSDNHSIANASTSGVSTTVNASDNGLSALNTLSGWLPTIAVIVAAAVIIGIVVLYVKG